MTISYDLCKVFEVVARTENYQDAASLLNISVAKVSRDIFILEKALKANLVIRKQGGKSVKLSQRGEVLLPMIRDLLVQTKTIIEAAANDPIAPEGNVKIISHSSVLENIIVPNIPFLTKQYPNIHLEIASADELILWERWDFDIILAPAELFMPYYVQKHLMDFHLALWASSKYLEEHGTPQTPADLRGHTLISLEDSAELLKYPKSQWHLALGLPKGEEHNIMSIKASKSLDVAGEKGVGIVPLSIENKILAGLDVVRVLPEINGPTVALHIKYHEALKNVEKIKCVEKWVFESFKKAEEAVKLKEAV